MTTAFIAAFAVHLVFALIQNLQAQAPGGEDGAGEEDEGEGEGEGVSARVTHVVKSRPRGVSNVINKLALSVLLLMALRYAWETGSIGRDLVNPGYVLGGLLLGHIVFALSCAITQDWLPYITGHFFNIRELREFLKENPETIFRFSLGVFSEELLYRAAAQPMLIAATDSPLLGIVVVAAVFSVIHWHFFRNPLLGSVEFVGFALLLGVLFHFTGSLTLVILVHAVRNLEIVFIEHLVALEESGGEDDTAPVAIAQGMQQA